MPECTWRARLLEAEVLVRSGRQSEAAVALAEAPPGGSRFAREAARRTWLLADLESARGHAERSEQLLNDAVQLATAAGDWDTRFEAGLSQGRQLFVFRHDPRKGEALFREIAEEAAARHDDFHEAGALNGIGMIRLKQQRFDEAIPWFQKTAEAARRGGGQRIIVAAGQNLAICYSQLGSFDEAIRSRQQAIDLLGKDGLAPYRMDLALEMGNTYFERGDSEKSIGYYRQALALAVNDGDKAQILWTLAGAYTNLRNWDEAEKSNEAARALVHDANGQLWVERNTAVIAKGRGRYAEAIPLYLKTIEDAKNRAVIRWEAHAGLAEIYRVTEDYARANHEFEQAIEVIDQNADQVSIPDYRLTFFSHLIEFYQSYVRLAGGAEAVRPGARSGGFQPRADSAGAGVVEEDGAEGFGSGV